MLEILDCDQAITPYLQFGDRVSIAMEDRSGQNLFGTISQQVVPASGQGG